MRALGRHKAKALVSWVKNAILCKRTVHRASWNCETISKADSVLLSKREVRQPNSIIVFQYLAVSSFSRLSPSSSSTWSHIVVTSTTFLRVSTPHKLWSILRCFIGDPPILLSEIGWKKRRPERRISFS